MQKWLEFYEARDLKIWGNPWYKLDDGTTSELEFVLHLATEVSLGAYLNWTSTPVSEGRAVIGCTGSTAANGTRRTHALSSCRDRGSAFYDERP